MKTIKFNHSLSIYIPELDNDGSSLDHLHNKINKVMLHQFGGLTETKATGFWLGTKIFIDNIIIYSASINNHNPTFLIELFLKICFRDSKQESFFYILNGVAYLVER